jgi:hypothetical protein
MSSEPFPGPPRGGRLFILYIALATIGFTFIAVFVVFCCIVACLSRRDAEPTRSSFLSRLAGPIGREKLAGPNDEARSLAQNMSNEAAPLDPNGFSGAPLAEIL